MDNCPVLSFLALFLELEIFLKDRGKTVSFQHASLMHDGILGCRQIFKVIEQRDIVSWRGKKKHPTIIFKKTLQVLKTFYFVSMSILLTQVESCPFPSTSKGK